MICPRISVEGSVPKHVKVEFPVDVALTSAKFDATVGAAFGAAVGAFASGAILRFMSV